MENPDIFAGNNPGSGGGNYSDDNVSDEFYWAAVELYTTAGKREYQDYLVTSGEFADAEAFDWGIQLRQA